MGDDIDGSAPDGCCCHHRRFRYGAPRPQEPHIELQELRRREQQLLRAIDSRDVIGQAKGILMERMRLDAEGAFALLRRTSQHLNTKLIEVAEHLARTGELPVGEARSAPVVSPSVPHDPPR